ncbi:hypothetical protein KP509_02G076800 [Ceratopteris richardii]|uniref:J domain-containing protein n=1 Tax=Ceratopteris richardii TaxID=49495 RepID=A0A8T2V7I2_CERRI|nr:hypothetical protein KP509_02G076800 [Ceratopteris richardii]KAH7444392.1 hypothetical protein KP509_02G076800 [Ceratopteris richardii]KAH7444395.1 hypothetical protein KP509_02G076800 [Ceratopteris richardii]KAH7444397.1 hypothetical protein KP509_02G076800 [Ceratopteris richardii]KAH7444399.1 hypothetical protein KP509_02G076800 [Ceratopteris richardii]
MIWLETSRPQKKEFKLLSKEADFSGSIQKIMGTKQEPPEIIVIEDDESDKSETHYPVQRNNSFASDANSCGSEIFSSEQQQWQSVNGFHAGHSDFSDKSYDDCFVMRQDHQADSGPSRLSWHMHRRAPRGEKRPAMMRNKLRRSSSSSDCQIIEDADGKFRQDWEKAALKKRFGSSYVGGILRVESEGSTNATGSGARWNSYGKENGHLQRTANKVHMAEFYCSGSSSEPSSKDVDSVPVTLLDQQDSNHLFADTRSEDESDSVGNETSMADTGSNSSGDNLEYSEEEASCSNENSVPIEGSPSGRMRYEAAVHLDLNAPKDISKDNETTLHATRRLPFDGSSFLPKVVKDTGMFHFSQDPSSCPHQELSLIKCEQAEHAQKKRKLAVECKKGVESSQRQGIEEPMENQQEEEQNNGFEEQVRGRIRLELEEVAAASVDMATLLRNLGVEVDGGVYPSVQQVDAAYRRALLHFHPDRVAALAKIDPLHRVEAEETFKLISRMKSTLHLVALY